MTPGNPAGRPPPSQAITGQTFSVATPAEPRGEKKTFFVVEILGGEELLEKCR